MCDSPCLGEPLLTTCLLLLFTFFLLRRHRTWATQPCDVRWMQYVAYVSSGAGAEARHAMHCNLL